MFTPGKFLNAPPMTLSAAPDNVTVQDHTFFKSHLDFFKKNNIPAAVKQRRGSLVDKTEKNIFPNCTKFIFRDFL
jgi:hypothetical protein